MDRRPLQTRQHSWARRLAAGLVKFGLTPNSVSMIGILFAAAAGGLLWDYGEQPWALLLAANTAYVRVFGGSVGLKQDFSGWGSKPRRMFWVTLTCLSASICQGLEL